MKTAIFDLDGTLLDSMGVWVQIDIDFLNKRGIALPNDYFPQVSRMHAREAAEYTIARFSLQETAEDLIAEWREMALTAYHETVELKPYAKAYLQKLVEQGVHIICATSGEECMVVPAMKRTGIFTYFQDIVYSSEVKRGKGFPDIYLEASKRTNTEIADCVVFEDILAGVVGAKQGGFYTIAIMDDASKLDHEEIKRQADRSIVTYLELL